MPREEMGQCRARRQSGIRKQMKGWRRERLRMCAIRSRVRYWVQGLEVEGGRCGVVVMVCIVKIGGLWKGM